MAAKLSHYALIGNSRAAALVSDTGGIDWCCLPEFDSPSIFAALLDRQQGGFYSIHPKGQFNSFQHYIADTNVVETIFENSEGKARLLDAFTAMTEQEKTCSLFPDHEILRMVEGISGTLTFRFEYAPRPYYGKHAAHLEDHHKLGIRFSWKENIYTLLSTLEPEQIKVEARSKSSATAEFSVKPGERILFSLSYSSQSPAVLPEVKTSGWLRLQQTISFWRNWISKCRYTGPYLEPVKRSALVLKLLAHAPSGAIIAAPTTSLPEQPGGARNWDYRFCWLRDASFTTRVLLKLGFEEEAHAYMSWILHATQLTRPKLQVVYSVFGHASLKEKTLDWLEGYRHSRPVRIGNGADKQFQLDVYGEVLDAIYAYAPHVKDFDRGTRKFILGLGEIICKLWAQPDNGIWEIRASPRHHTHSLAMAWVGLDRLVRLARQFGWKEAPTDKFNAAASAIRQAIEQFGYNKVLGSYTRELQGETVDASLLTLSLMGYCEPTSPRMQATTRRIYAHLSENNLLYRYKNIADGLQGEEGFFGICNFWLAENLVRSGELEKGIQVFDTILQLASPAGLLSEEIDAKTHELTGNYPQGFSHIGLINAALSIQEVQQQAGIKK